MKTTIMLTGLCLAVAACTDEEPGQAEQLIGTWKACGAEISELTFSFEEDGGFVYEERRSDGELQLHAVGTYVATEERFRGDAVDDAGGPAIVDIPYRVIDDQLVLSTLRPEGANDGVVGVWVASTELVFEGETFGGDIRLDIRDDGTVTWTSTGLDGTPSSLEGTWAVDGAAHTFTFPFGGDSSVSFSQRYYPGDEVIGTAPYCRVP